MYDQKYQKSFKRIFHPLKNLFPRARVSRVSHAWQVCAANSRVKVGGFAALRHLNYTTRANIAHEKAEQIRARIVCTPAENRGGAGVGLVCARTKRRIYFLFYLLVYLALSCRGRRYPVSATPTHTLRVCVNSLDDPLWQGRQFIAPFSCHGSSG